MTYDEARQLKPGDMIRRNGPYGPRETGAFERLLRVGRWKAVVLKPGGKAYAWSVVHCEKVP